MLFDSKKKKYYSSAMWFTRTADQVIEELGADISAGLSAEEAEQRLEQFGPNTLKAGKKRTLLSLFFQQLNNVLIYILIGAAALSFLLGELSDGIIIFAVILINGIIGVVQESKAENALEELKKMASPKAVVRRGGETLEIDAERIVPGDVIILEAGRIVPCDIRLIETADLKIKESALTGESVPVDKDGSAVFPSQDIPTADRTNMAFMSTIVTFGRGVGIAAGTGEHTEIGNIARMLAEDEDETTPLQKKLDGFGKTIGIIILVLCAVMFGISSLQEYLRHGFIPRESLFESFLTAVSLAVAAIPEGLTAIVTIVLALGVQRMSRENAIVRRLPAVETLGSVTVICSDKTGTLTQNRMTVRRYSLDGAELPEDGLNPEYESHRRFLEGMVLCNDATLSTGTSTGDPTEIALLDAALKYTLSKEALIQHKPRVGEKPFDSERKMMSTVHAEEGTYTVYTKGAIDNLVTICSAVFEKGKILPLENDKREELLLASEGMSRDALRVLGVAYKKMDADLYSTDTLEQDLVFLGFLGMIDPPRLEVKDSVEECRRSGVRTVMITGDHKTTALAIARELGIASGEQEALSGSELNTLDDSRLREMVKTVKVFARVSPEHKVRIVKALKDNGNIVSMTGDGVNDAPSLQSADIGVAMGITGTDVAKGASDMVLTDDNFSTIVKAVEEGRNIFNNLKKTITFLLSCNAGEIVAIFTAILFGWVPPLRPTHILWVNLITDTFPALALGVEPPDPDVMEQPPRNPKESIFAGGTGKQIILNGLLIGALTLGIYSLGRVLYPENLIHAQTLAFGVLSFAQLFHAFNLRHNRKSIFTLGIAGNPYVFAALATGIFLQILIISTPGVSGFFKVVPLSLFDWMIVFAFSLVPIAVHELVKVFLRAVKKRSTYS